jgi:hypothetical protein
MMKKEIPDSEHSWTMCNCTVEPFLVLDDYLDSGDGWRGEFCQNCDRWGQLVLWEGRSQV